MLTLTTRRPRQPPARQLASMRGAARGPSEGPWEGQPGRSRGRPARAAQEVQIMQQCSFDRNIVQFYGFCPSPPMLVLEFMEARPPAPPPHGPTLALPYPTPSATRASVPRLAGPAARPPSRSLRGQQPVCAGCRAARARPAGRRPVERAAGPRRGRDALVRARAHARAGRRARPALPARAQGAPPRRSCLASCAGLGAWQGVRVLLRW